MIRGMTMKLFDINLNRVLKIRTFGKETLIPPRLHVSRTVTEYIIYVITDGELHLVQNGEELILMPGDVFFFDKGDVHSASESTYCEYYYIHFDSDSVNTLETSSEEYKKMIEKNTAEYLKTNVYSTDMYDFCNVYIKQKYNMSSKGRFEHILAILREIRFTSESRYPKNRLAVSYTVTNLLFELQEIELFGKSEKAYHTVRKVAEYIDKNYATIESCNDVESYIKLNVDYVNRIFKKIMGCSIIKYRNRVRIIEAKFRIAATDMNMSEIADFVGFGNVYYFSRIFKKIEGVAPSDYAESIFRARKYGSENI